MNNREFEDSADKNWDFQEEFSWTEFDWQHYLKDNQNEIEQFLKLYHQLKDDRENFEQISHMMGWEGEDAISDDEDDMFLSLKSWAIESSNDTPDPNAPYTVHKHPVYIVTRGLYKYLNNCLEYLASKQELNITPKDVMKFATALNTGETNAIMAVNTLDVGDFNLSICHLKIALDAINQNMHLLNTYAEKNLDEQKFIFNKMLPVCFDIREMWIRVMNECREEVRHQDPDHD